MSMIDWVGEKPPKADEWESIAEKRASGIERVGAGAVRIRKTPDGRWWIEGARVGANPSFPENKAFDFRRHLTEALDKEDKPVLGLGALQEPLTPAREEAIRSSVDVALRTSPFNAKATLFDIQVVGDLLDEVDRLRAKLQLAAHARDLAGQAGSKLRDACEDITPRPTRATRRTDPNA